MTSGKLCHPGSWEDIKHGIEYVGKKYVRGKGTNGEKRTRYYAYGCSMGATILGLYLINDAASADRELDGAVLYGTPWDYNKGFEYFMTGWGGWPSYALVKNLCRVTRAWQLPQLKEHLSKEEYDHYEKGFTDCKGYDDLVNNVWLRMHDYQSLEHFLESLTLNGKLGQIGIPLFAFGSKDDLVLHHSTIPRDEIE